ncbi:MAG TPA: ATP-binding protein [Acidobacteriota bacterium]|nr:ATP-binding protein [Acidobacteriota bacterium]
MRWAVRLTASAAIIAAITVLYFHVAAANATTVALSFLLAILGIATGWGLVESLFASVLAVISFNYFFLPPIRTLTISDPQNWVALLAFLVTSVTVSQLSVRAKRRAAEAIERRLEVERLYELGQAMLLSSGLRPAARETVNRIMQIFDIPSAAFYLKSENAFFRSDPGVLSDQQLRDAAECRDPDVDLESQTALVPLRLGGQTIGSLGFTGRVLSNAALNAVAYLVAISIERARSLEEASRLEAARQSESLKSALLDALAHDFKTPLTSIKGAVTHLLGKKHDDEEQELLSLANEETERLNRLVVEALEMARIDAGRLHPDRQPQKIDAIVSAALLDLESILTDRTVEIRIPSDLPRAEVDFEFIQQVIKQVIDNAARYSPAGSPITVSAESSGEKIVVSVQDRGPGIDEQEQSRIFDKFFRGRGSEQLSPGTGLGLSIAKGIVEAHGGRIWVASRPGVGSVFSFSLPAFKGEARQ